jgi:hypothetical protein
VAGDISLFPAGKESSFEGINFQVDQTLSGKKQKDVFVHEMDVRKEVLPLIPKLSYI